MQFKSILGAVSVYFGLCWFCVRVQHTNALIDFYQLDSNAYNGTVWAHIRFNFSEYLPTCGWTLMTTSWSHTLAGVKNDYDLTSVRYDPYSFLLTNAGQWGNLEKSSPSGHLAIVITGTFGNTNPNVTVYWYCICDASTSGICKLVPPYNSPATTSTTSPAATTLSTSAATSFITTAAPNNSLNNTTSTMSSTSTTASATAATASTTSTSAASTTTTPITAAATTQPVTAAATTSAPTTLAPRSASTASTFSTTSWTTTTASTKPDSSRIEPRKSKTSIGHLVKQTDHCYTGSLLTIIHNVPQLLYCSALCIEDQACLGINFWQLKSLCYLIHEDTNATPGLTKKVTDCVYYIIV